MSNGTAVRKEADFAAWKRTVNTKNGPVEVLSVTIEGKRYTGWPNTFKKEGEKSPDYRFFLDEYKPGQQSAPRTGNIPPISEPEDDLPF